METFKIAILFYLFVWKMGNFENTFVSWLCKICTCCRRKKDQRDRSKVSKTGSGLELGNGNAVTKRSPKCQCFLAEKDLLWPTDCNGWLCNVRNLVYFYLHTKQFTMMIRWFYILSPNKFEVSPKYTSNPPGENYSGESSICKTFDLAFSKCDMYFAISWLRTANLFCIQNPTQQVNF